MATVEAQGRGVGRLMGERSESNSGDSERDYDDEEEEGDGEERSRQMLDFMFGNVDDLGDLDEEYLGEDAKEHLLALAHQLSPSFVDVGVDDSRREEHEDYDLKADDAVDYEDIEEQYEGPEVESASQDMHKFFSDAALAGPIKLVESDEYDKDDDFDSELNTSELEDEARLIEDDEEELPIVQEGCRTSVVDVIATSNEDCEGEEEKDRDQILGLQETSTSSTKEKEEKVAKVLLPVICQEDGKDVVSFSELFGEQEPYWVLGHWKGREIQGYIGEERDRAKEGSEAVEDDQEVELKRCSRRPLVPAADLPSAEGFFESEGSSEDSHVGSSNEEDGTQTSTNLSYSRRNRFKQKRLVFFAAEPMKVDLNFYESDVAESVRQIPDGNFDLIHQGGWDDDILWDTPKRGGSISGQLSSCQLVEVDSESEQSHLSSIDHEHPSIDQPGVELNDYFQWQRPCVIESLCQRNSELEDAKELTTSTKFLRHPQMLRLEAHSFDEQIGVEARAELLKRISNMANEAKEKNQELARGDWLSSISWGELEPGLPKPLVIFDLMDPQMVFEMSEAKNGLSTYLHAAALVLTPGGAEGAHDGAKGTVNASLSLTRFNFSNDKHYTNETHEQQNLNEKKCRAIYVVNVMHSLPAITLQGMKLELSNKDLANFHRPKAAWYPHHNEVAAKKQGKLAARGHMIVVVKILSGKESKFTVNASETLDVLKAKTAKKLGDLKPSEKTKVFYSGKELVDGFTLAQQHVLPNSVLHFVRTEIYPWPKAQRPSGEDELLRPPGAFRTKSELSVKDGHVALMEYCEERPLLLGNVGMGAHLCTYYQKRSPKDATAFALRADRSHWVGTCRPLEPTDDSPFLGDIQPGEIQSSLETNMYRAPVFPHKVAITDFLLVRSPKGKLSLRRFDSVHVVGQQEPHMEVLTPNSKSMWKYRLSRFIAYVYRVFREIKEKPGFIPPHVRADDIMSQFSWPTEGWIRRRLQHCAVLKQIGGEIYWVMRQNFRIPSEGEIRRLVTPENVCTYESMQAGLHHLKHMGIHKLTQMSGLAAAMNQLPNEQKTIAAASHIEKVLQITPWNLSNNFVAATMQGMGSLEQLEIVGPGDPSDRGLGFSYLPAATKPNKASAVVEERAAAARGGRTVVGTDADLRRLGKEAAGEVLSKFKVPEETINELTRWGRIGMIRKLSSKQAASGFAHGATVLNKFARRKEIAFLELKRHNWEKCQDIWNRQVQSLSMPDDDDSKSDGEIGGDLDSFVGDLENYLEESSGDASGDLDSFADYFENHKEAEEGDEGGVKKGKQEGRGGLRAQLRKQIAQEEDSEDEEAEAAGLMRMLRADDEAEEELKKMRSVLAIKEKKLEDIEPPLALGGDRQAGKKNAFKTANQKGGTDKDDAVKKGTLALPLDSKVLKKSRALMKEMSIKRKISGKFGQNTLLLACEACGQFGHMRTNKKCLSYTEEEREPVTWQDSGAAALGLVGRQGTKIIIKRKFINSIPTKTLEELNLPIPVQPSVIKRSIPKEFPPTLPLFNPLSTLRIKINVSGANQSLDTSPAPSVSKCSLVKVEKKHGAHTNVCTGETCVRQTSRSPLLKFKLFIQKQKDHGVQRLNQDQDVDAARTDREKVQKRERIEERVAYKEALIEEREREKSKREEQEQERGQRERDSKKRDERVLKRKATKREREQVKLMERERGRQEVEEYQCALNKGLKGEQEELARKEEKHRMEQVKSERERHRQHVKEKEKRREQRRLQDEEMVHKADLEAQKAAQEREEKEKDLKIRLMKKQTRDVSSPPSARSGVKDRRGKGIKRRLDVPTTSYNRTTDSKRLRKKGGVVHLCNILEGVVDTLKNAYCSYLFLRPVHKEDAPDYLHYVKRPMDLSTIRDRVRKLEYKSREDFLNDVRQIADNAHLYNKGRNPWIPPLADRLLELCDEELEARDKDLDDAEAGVVADLTWQKMA